MYAQYDINLIMFGRPGMAVHILLQISQSFMLLFCSLFCFFWALYCTIRPGYKRKWHHMIIMCLPFITLFVFLLINYSTGLIFRITEASTYVRGPFFHITSLCTYSYVVFSIVQVLHNKHNLSKKEYYPYLFVPIFPMLVGIVKLLFDIEFSIGYKVFANVEGLGTEEIFSSIDEQMYKNKQSKSDHGYSKIRFEI